MIDPNAIAALVYLGALAPGQQITETQLQSMLLTRDVRIAEVLFTSASAKTVYDYYNTQVQGRPILVLDEDELDVHEGGQTTGVLSLTHNLNVSLQPILVLDEDELD